MTVKDPKMKNFESLRSILGGLFLDSKGEKWHCVKYTWQNIPQRHEYLVTLINMRTAESINITPATLDKNVSLGKLKRVGERTPKWIESAKPMNVMNGNIHKFIFEYIAHYEFYDEWLEKKGLRLEDDYGYKLQWGLT